MAKEKTSGSSTNKSTTQSKVAAAVATNKAAQTARTTRLTQTADTLKKNADKGKKPDTGKGKGAGKGDKPADKPGIPAKTPVDNYEYTDASGNKYKITTYSDGSSNKEFLGTDSTNTVKPEDYTSQREALKASLKSQGLRQSFIDDVDKIALDLLSEYEGDAESVANVILYNDKVTVKGVEQESPFKKYYGKFNDALTKANRATLTPAEIVNNIVAYERVLKNTSGLSDRFWSDDQMTQYFVNEISPTELTKRINDAQARVAAADPRYKATVKAYYGMDDSEILGFVLDPAIGEEELSKRQTAAAIGASAARSNISLSRQRAEELASLGISEEKAVTGFGQIAQDLEATQRLASYYKEDTTGLQTELEQEQFLGIASQKRKQLQQREQAKFTGQAGTSRGSLSRQTSGTF